MKSGCNMCGSLRNKQFKTDTISLREYDLQCSSRI